jgi:hypothetical protein
MVFSAEFFLETDFCTDWATTVSRVKRLRVTDRISLVTVDLPKTRPGFIADEFPILVALLEESRRKLDCPLCGSVPMPDHRHALLEVNHPLPISRVVQVINEDIREDIKQDIKRDIQWDIQSIFARRLNRSRQTARSLECV